MTDQYRETVSGIAELERPSLWTDADAAEQADLERISDALLTRAGIICHRRGVRKRLYTEKQLANHRRRELTNYEEGLNLCMVAEKEFFELIGRDLFRIIGKSGLSLKQNTVWELYMAGANQEEIARITRTTQSTVSRQMAAGKRKIVAALMCDPYYGWWEVYWSEVNRGRGRK